MSAPLVCQSELRALLVLPALPQGHIAIPVTAEDFGPHLRPGEFAVVDTADRDLVRGELYFVAWTGGANPDGSERGALCQVFRRDHVYDGKPFSAWWVGSMRDRVAPEDRARLVRENRWSALGWSNGPYREGMLERQVRGRVIGILAPSFEEPKRLAAGGAA